MGKKSLLTTVCLSVVLLAAAFIKPYVALGFQKTNDEAQLNNSQLSEKVDQLFTQWDKPDSPGCALGIIQNGVFIYKRGYGSANLDYNIPISTGTAFYIASTSKQFTAISIAFLAKQGKISLDDDIRKYLPEMPQYQSTITIRNLIHHSSGIRDYLNMTELSGRHTEDIYSDKDYLNLITRQKNLNFKPGDEFLYSNSGYFLLAEIVKRVSGKTLQKFAAENIFQPLGMTNTHFRDDSTEIIKNRATGYLPNQNGFSVLMTNFSQVGDGGLITTVEDLLLWDKNFYDNKLGGGADLVNQFTTPGTLNNGEKSPYAFALFAEQYKGLKLIYHGGSFNGFRAEMLRFPEQKFSVICLCNLYSINATSLSKKIADIYLADQEKPDDANRAKTTSDITNAAIENQDLNAFVGSYFDPSSGASRRIIIKGDKLLYVVRDPNKAVELKPIEINKFLATNIPNHLEVSFTNKSAAIKEIKSMDVAIDYAKPTTFDVFQPTNYTAEDLRKFVGTFYSEELDAKYVLSFEDNKLLLQVGTEEVLLEALGADTFKNSQGMIFNFKRNRKNNISGFLLSAGRVRGVDFNKI